MGNEHINKCIVDSGILCLDYVFEKVGRFFNY